MCRYVEEGVSFSLNSDDPGIMRTTLSHDYQKAVEYFGIAKDYLPTIVSILSALLRYLG